MDRDSTYILDEIKKIKYLYKMKGVFRFGTERDPWKRAESNAEHLYGMTVLVNYFIPLVEESEVLDRQKILDLVFVHDLDEIEFGDIISYKKTDADREREQQSMQTALSSMPEMVFDTATLVDEYNAQQTREAQFVKAIDKLEPLVELFDKYGKEITLREQTTKEQSLRGKSGYVAQFAIIEQYFYILAEEMDRQGFFYESDS